jgi:hypothetical protein
MVISNQIFPLNQSEAARALKKITTGTRKQIQMLVASGAVPLLVEIVSSPNDTVKATVCSS